ncbi:MAG: penicillin acylase family protein [Hyphomonadaceae bacterium]
MSIQRQDAPDRERGPRRRSVRLAAVAMAPLLAASLAACATGSAPETDTATAPPVAAQAPAPKFAASIRRTEYGVPHVKAENYGGLGYGIGYVSGQDNVCEIAERILTANGTRAKWLGPGEKDSNVASDLYHRRLIQTGELEQLMSGPADSVDTPSADARAMIAGYVAGYNRALRETGVDNITDPRCKGAPWVREITETEYWRHIYAGQVVYQLAGVSTAAPPGAEGQKQAALDEPLIETTQLGSNAFGLGREVTKSGYGVLLGNPHYPWDGQNRFYRMHLMIPGKLNVVGAGLVTNATVGIGHTDSFAWSHTVSTARRFGYFELKLDPSDPTRYMVDGVSTPMTSMDVTVDVKDGDTTRPVTHTFYTTKYGPLIETESLPWSKEHAYAMRIMPQGVRTIDQYIDMWKAHDVHELAASLRKYQATGFNTTAVDKSGEAFYGDMGMVPNVSAALAGKCTTSDLAKKVWSETRVPVLDGSRSECDWATDPDSTAPGVFGASATPQIFRTDYVSQSNDSYWLTNPKAPMTGYSPIFGDEGTARSLRTRLGVDIIAQRVAGADGFEGKKFDLRTLQETLYANRHLGGELVRDDLVAACRKSKSAKLKPACDALAGWDAKVNLDSRGAHLFHLFAQAGGLVFKDKFDAAHPETTPAVLDTANPKVLKALEEAVDKLNELKIPLDAPLSAVQNEVRNGAPIPIHGGAGQEGVFNVITVDPASLEPEKGWTSIRHGSSWIMTVEFTPDGPKSEGILTYSQSTNPNSPWYSDETRLYSNKGWDDLRFTDAAVEEGTVSRTEISE